MLQYLQQNQANLSPQQQALLHQLTSQYRLMQQHLQQLRQRQQQQQQQQSLQGGGQSGNSSIRPNTPQQFQQGQSQQQNVGSSGGGFQQSGARTPQTGTVAQTGFDMDSGNFPAATGHTQPAAGMPFKSATMQNPGFQHIQNNQGNFTQITSTTTNQQHDLGMFNFKLTFLLVQCSR